jgi:hypothetical protein
MHTKETVQLTPDNFLDYLPLDYAAHLVKGFEFGTSVFESNPYIVNRFLAWVAREGSRSPEFDYELSRRDAAVILQELAGD